MVDKALNYNLITPEGKTVITITEDVDEIFVRGLMWNAWVAKYYKTRGGWKLSMPCHFYECKIEPKEKVCAG